MKRLTNAITNAIQRENTELTELQIKTIKYGIECLLGEISKIIIYAILFSVFSVVDHFFIAALFFCVLRILAGGYHAETYWRCFFVTLFTFVVIIVFGTKFMFSVSLKVYMIIISMVLAAVFAPADHPNKPIISKSRRLRLKYISVIAMGIMGAISFLLPTFYSGTAVIAIFTEAITIPLGELVNRRRCA